jgi:hypothetical protein
MFEITRVPDKAWQTLEKLIRSKFSIPPKHTFEIDCLDEDGDCAVTLSKDIQQGK